MNNTNKTKKLTTSKKKVDSISKSTRSKIVSSIQDAIDRDYIRFQNEVDIPNLRCLDWKCNFEKEDNFDKGTVVGYESAASDFKRVNRITWVLTAVNVAIFISLILKNI